MIKRIFALLIILTGIIFLSSAQTQTPTDSAALRALLVGRALPQERVYLHFDNTAYYLGETMWFKAFVTSHGDDNPTVLSRVLYVELMSPEGYVVKTGKYRIDDNGTCHGEIFLDPKYLSGFFEIRAYTRYMLNWGDETIFSRVFPVYDKVNNGDWEFRNIRDRSQSLFANKVFKKEIVPELRFYPESGHLVNGIESRVAYELTGFEGIELYDEITIFADGKELLKTTPRHMGKGCFTFTPHSGTEYAAEVYITDKKGKKKKYEFELPGIEYGGCVLSVTEKDDGINLGIRSNLVTKDTIGFAILHRNGLGFYQKIEGDSVTLTVGINELHEGVNRAILFQGRRPLAERLFFVQHDSLQAGDRQTVKLRVTGNGYMMHNLEPGHHGKVSIVVEREDGKPLDAETEFALSVNDQSGVQTTSWGYNLYTYLLLGSELKGYIPDAYQYFDPENTDRKQHLDLVMLTNGWTAYDWSELTTESFRNIVPPEDGITVKGDLVLRVRNRKFGEMGQYKVHPQPYMSVRIDFTANDSTIKAQAFRTDSIGKFSIILDDFTGRQTVALSPETYIRHSNKVNYAFYMDKYFSPKPRRFSFWQQNVGSSVRLRQDSVKGMRKIGAWDYLLDGVDVKVKFNRRITTTSPISELRLDYLEEWEYAMDVGLGRDTDHIYRSVHDNSIPDARYESDNDNEEEEPQMPGVLEAGRHQLAWEEFDSKGHNVLTVADVLTSIYGRYDLGWQNWVQPVVVKGEYNSDSIPVADNEYIHGIDVEAMTNFSEVIITSDPKKLESVDGSPGIWERRSMVIDNKHPYERFYHGFLLQMRICYKIDSTSRIHDTESIDELSLSLDRLITMDNQAKIFANMEHPNNVAYLIPDKRDNKSLIRNDLSVSSSTRRYTSVQGYTVPKQFYSPDYSTMAPDGKDYRRTLLWNPSVKAIDGKLTVELYNSSICDAMAVDVLGYNGNTVFSNNEYIATREDCSIKRNNRVRPQRKSTQKMDSAFLAQCEHEFGTAEIYYNKKNYKKALTAYIELLQYNYPPAFYRVGEFYSKGINLKKRYDLAAQFFERGAELGEARCYYELSQMHAGGLHFQQSKEKEVELLEIASGLNEPRAMLQLGRYLLKGEGLEKDTLRATGLFKELALAKDPAAMYEYAVITIASGVENDSIIGTPLRFMVAAAENGSTDALMWMLEHEKDSGNLEQAYTYAKELHLLNDVRGTLYLADCYYHGRVVKRDKSLAKDLYREAAAAGSEEAKEWLRTNR